MFAGFSVIFKEREKYMSKNIYNKENNINEDEQNTDGMENKYKHLNGLKLTKEECKVLKYLRKKEESEIKKYRKKYGSI
jgi:hypothetical protein